MFIYPNDRGCVEHVTYIRGLHAQV